MWIRGACGRAQIAVTFTFVAFFATSVFGQTPSAAPGTIESQIEQITAENAALREQLRKIEEQQKVLTEMIRIAQPAAGSATPEASFPASGSAGTEVALPPTPAPAPGAPAQQIQPASVATQSNGGRFNDGIIIAQSSEDAPLPYLLKFNDDTQLRYLNTIDSDETFTDHLGNVREVHRRNDITVNRQMFNFSGFVFDPKAAAIASRSGPQPAPPRS